MKCPLYATAHLPHPLRSDKDRRKFRYKRAGERWFLTFFLFQLDGEGRVRGTGGHSNSEKPPDISLRW
jgi:hypothetical protein